MGYASSALGDRLVAVKSGEEMLEHVAFVRIEQRGREGRDFGHAGYHRGCFSEANHRRHRNGAQMDFLRLEIRVLDFLIRP